MIKMIMEFPFLQPLNLILGSIFFYFVIPEGEV